MKYRYFTFLTQCKEPKACSIVLRGPSKDVIAEIERNLQDAMCVARNVFFSPSLAPGGGATEMAVSVKLEEKAKLLEGIEQWPYRSAAEALEVIPRTLIQNCGGNAIKTLTQLRAKHANGEHTFGIDGETGKVVDMTQHGIWEPSAVKVQTIKTAFEVSIIMMRHIRHVSTKSDIMKKKKTSPVGMLVAARRRYRVWSVEEQGSGRRRWHGSRGHAGRCKR